MTGTVKHKPMMITLICASVFQLISIIADQYVLYIDFQVEKLKHEISIDESFEYDLQNTMNILRFAYRSSDDMRLNEFFSNDINFTNSSEKAVPYRDISLNFMISEIKKIYDIHSVQYTKSEEGEYDLITLAKPLYEKISDTKIILGKKNELLNNFDDERHRFILFAVVAQILGLSSLLGFFLFALKEN